jgi:AcrR family transcriptional regulator
MSMYASRARGRNTGSRVRILAAVREMLEEGVFHSSTVEEVAERAGVSRATLYQHFGTRLGLIDATCDLMGANPALGAIRETEDVAEFIARVVDFWASEEKLLAQLYGIVAVDPAAKAFVDRQRRDRYGEIRRVLSANGRGDAFAALAAVTSFDAYRELRRHAGLSKRDVVETLQRLVRL